MLIKLELLEHAEYERGLQQFLVKQDHVSQVRGTDASVLYSN